MKLSYFGKLIVAMGFLFFVSIIIWLVQQALYIGDGMDNRMLAAIGITGSLFVILIGLGIAFNINAYTTKKIHISKFICQEECDSAFYLDCDMKHCIHAKPHSRTAECDRIGCVRIITKSLT